MRRGSWGALPSWLAALALALAPIGCAGALRDRAESAALVPIATPLFWHARAPGGGGLYLLGSVHIRVIDAPALGPEIQRAYDESDELVVEVDITQITPADGRAAIERYATLPPHLTLDAVVSPETRELVARYLDSRGLSADQFQRYKPWFVAQLILMTELRSAGYDADLGVDRAFLDQASGGKSIVGLETIDSQFEMLDRPSLELQEVMLKDAILRIDELEKSTGKLLEAWSRGDEADLERQIFQPLEEVPELEGYYDALIWQRNTSMAERLVEIASDGRMRFVVLGAGHMVGARSIPAQLAEQGFVVERIGPGVDSGGPGEAAAPRP